MHIMVKYRETAAFGEITMNKHKFPESKLTMIVSVCVMKDPTAKSKSKVSFSFTSKILQKVTYKTLCTIWYYLYNLKHVKNTHGEVLILC